jgi:hypothetical protein
LSLDEVAGANRNRSEKLRDRWRSAPSIIFAKALRRQMPRSGSKATDVTM